jgi:hypothetical protein
MSESTQIIEKLMDDIRKLHAQVDVFKSGLEYLENRLYESGRSSDVLTVINQMMEIGWRKDKVLDEIDDLPSKGYPWEPDEDE